MLNGLIVSPLLCVEWCYTSPVPSLYKSHFIISNTFLSNKLESTCRADRFDRVFFYDYFVPISTHHILWYSYNNNGYRLNCKLSFRIKPTNFLQQLHDEVLYICSKSTSSVLFTFPKLHVAQHSNCWDDSTGKVSCTFSLPHWSHVWGSFSTGLRIL